MRKSAGLTFLGFLFVVVVGAVLAGVWFRGRAAQAYAGIGRSSTSASPAAGINPGWECVPATAGQAVVSGGTGATPSCGAGTTAVLAPTYVAVGVGGKPTVVFSTVNVQVVSGSGSTSGAINGEGNLVVGYAENTRGHAQTGSHNLVVGSENGWASYAGIIGGFSNQTNAKYSTVVGSDNTAAGGWSLVAGDHNKTKGQYSSVTGGLYNLANGSSSAVAGGCENVAGTGTRLAGSCNTDAEAVLGGFGNSASGLDSTVTGGEANFSSATAASVLGGDSNTATMNCQAIPAAPGSC